MVTLQGLMPVVPIFIFLTGWAFILLYPVRSLNRIIDSLNRIIDLVSPAEVVVTFDLL